VADKSCSSSQKQVKPTKPMQQSKAIWIATGYQIFALQGEEALKIESLARKVGVSKSSFYHYFADLEVFIEALLQFHLAQAHIIAQKEQEAQTVAPDLITILVTHKIDLLFNRQLRIHQNKPHYAATLKASDKIVGNAFAQVWVQDLRLKLSPQQIESVFSLALHNFYLQINESNLTYEWLANYFVELKKIARSFE
jgi:AcrR family transcriptional regulator